MKLTNAAFRLGRGVWIALIHIRAVQIRVGTVSGHVTLSGNEFIVSVHGTVASGGFLQKIYFSFVKRARCEEDLVKNTCWENVGGMLRS